MRAKAKKQIKELLNTVREAMGYLASSEISQAVREELTDHCKIALESIISQLNEEEEAFILLKGQAEEIREGLDQISMDLEKLDEKLYSLQKDIEKSIKCKLKVVFLPYKYSMWDCMDSVWNATKQDPECDCHVVPIPYYDKNPDGSLGKKHYEGNAFPMEIEDYNSFLLDEPWADIIYIHNPYDHRNLVTTVDPRFYSAKLVHYTDMLVYIPYFLSGVLYYDEQYKDIAYALNKLSARQIILQSQEMKRCLCKNGIQMGRLAVLGNPKLDALQGYLEHVQIPKEWKELFAGKKVVLFNSSLTTFFFEKNWFEEILNILNFILSDPRIGLIWRPHPLLKETIMRLCPAKINLYRQIRERISSSNCAVMDEGSDAYCAIAASDGLISDYSSLIPQYTFTGKPSLSLVDSSKLREEGIVLCDYFGNYFTKDGTTVEEFIEMLLSGKDEKKEERLRHARASVENWDGSCGKKVHEHIKILVNESLQA